MRIVWVTKYALTTGIKRVRGETSEDDSDFFRPTDGWTTFYKDEWHLTTGLALEQAEKMRIKRIASLKKQLAKMESLKIEVKD